MSTKNNNFSNFAPQGTATVMLQEWILFLTSLNLKLNTLYTDIQNILSSTISGTATMASGTVTISNLKGVTKTSVPQVTMQIGGTQTGFLQAICGINSLTITSTVDTDAGQVYYFIDL